MCSCAVENWRSIFFIIIILKHLSPDCLPVWSALFLWVGDRVRCWTLPGSCESLIFSMNTELQNPLVFTHLCLPPRLVTAVSFFGLWSLCREILMNRWESCQIGCQLTLKLSALTPCSLFYFLVCLYGTTEMSATVSRGFFLEFLQRVLPSWL